jgi:hypothetical protein
VAVTITVSAPTIAPPMYPVKIWQRSLEEEEEEVGVGRSK